MRNWASGKVIWQFDWAHGGNMCHFTLHEHIHTFRHTYYVGDVFSTHGLMAVYDKVKRKKSEV